MGSALTLGTFGCACMIIAMGAIAGMSGTADDGGLALAFGGVFAIPLAMLGAYFLVVAIWTAANSLTVRINAAGLHTQRRLLGVRVAQRALSSGDVVALDARLAAKYLGLFSRQRRYRVVARSNTENILVADCVKGYDATVEFISMIAAALGRADLASNDLAPGAGGNERSRT